MRWHIALLVGSDSVALPCHLSYHPRSFQPSIPSRNNECFATTQRTLQLSWSPYLHILVSFKTEEAVRRECSEFLSLLEKVSAAPARPVPAQLLVQEVGWLRDAAVSTCLLAAAVGKGRGDPGGCRER